jgi:NAD(P)H-dependent FMN reductase
MKNQRRAWVGAPRFPLRDGAAGYVFRKPTAMNILILSCSLNPESNSRLLARAVLAECEQQGISATFADLRDYPLPLCDGAAAYGDPNVARIGEMISAASGIVLATPIYNYNVNAAAKNVIELTGRQWEDKTVAFLCAAGAQSSYMSVMGLANNLMFDFRCVIVPRFVYATDRDFDGQGISDAKVQERIGRMVEELYSLAAARKPKGS